MGSTQIPASRSKDPSGPDQDELSSTTETITDFPESPVDDVSMTLTDVLTVISNRRRRFVLHYLKQSGASATIGELSTQIAAWELNKPAARVSSAERKNVYNALAQTHVRRLRENGFVFAHRGNVELTPEAKAIRIHVDIVPDKDIPWSQYYLGLGVFGLIVSLAFVFFAPTVIPAGGLGVFFAVSVLVSAVSHWYYKRRMCIGVGNQPPELRYE